MKHVPLILLALALGTPGHATDEPLVRAIEMPLQAKRLRAAGVPASEVAEAVRATHERGLSGKDATDVLDEGADASEEQGPIDNFGKFVNDKLDEGLRGRDLAEAIHQEHERQGKGKGKDKDKDKGGPPEGRGPDEGKGGNGPPDDKGGKGGKGKSGKSKGGR